ELGAQLHSLFVGQIVVRDVEQPDRGRQSDAVHPARVDAVATKIQHSQLAKTFERVRFDVVGHHVAEVELHQTGGPVEHALSNGVELVVRHVEDLQRSHGLHHVRLDADNLRVGQSQLLQQVQPLEDVSRQVTDLVVFQVEVGQAFQRRKRVVL